MDYQIQISPVTAFALGFIYYDTSQEEWYVEGQDDYYEHYTFLLFIFCIKIIRY